MKWYIYKICYERDLHIPMATFRSKNGWFGESRCYRTIMFLINKGFINKK